MKEKTFCANCKVHCYKPEMREQIRQVMRFQDQGCYYTIQSLQYGIWYTVDYALIHTKS